MSKKEHLRIAICGPDDPATRQAFDRQPNVTVVGPFDAREDVREPHDLVLFTDPATDADTALAALRKRRHVVRVASSAGEAPAAAEQLMRYAREHRLVLAQMRPRRDALTRFAGHGPIGAVVGISIEWAVPTRMPVEYLLPDVAAQIRPLLGRGTLLEATTSLSSSLGATDLSDYCSFQAIPAVREPASGGSYPPLPPVNGVLATSSPQAEPTYRARIQGTHGVGVVRLAPPADDGTEYLVTTSSTGRPTTEVDRRDHHGREAAEIVERFRHYDRDVESGHHANDLWDLECVDAIRAGAYTGRDFERDPSGDPRHGGV